METSKNKSLNAISREGSEYKMTTLVTGLRNRHAGNDILGD